MAEYTTKDSGERSQYESGMQRDTEAGKARFDLLIPLGVPYEEQFLTRVAELFGRGAVKYDDRNWEKADSDAEMARMKSSAYRHFMQWLCGETDEDHAAAVVFNLIAHETTAYKVARADADAVAKAAEAAEAVVAPSAYDWGVDFPNLRVIQDQVNEDIARLAQVTKTPRIWQIPENPQLGYLPTTFTLHFDGVDIDTLELLTGTPSEPARFVVGPEQTTDLENPDPTAVLESEGWVRLGEEGGKVFFANEEALRIPAAKQSSILSYPVLLGPDEEIGNGVAVDEDYGPDLPRKRRPWHRRPKG